MVTTQFLAEVMVVFHPQSIIMTVLMGQVWQETSRRSDTDGMRDAFHERTAATCDVVFAQRVYHGGRLK